MRAAKFEISRFRVARGPCASKLQLNYELSLRVHCRFTWRGVGLGLGVGSRSLNYIGNPKWVGGSISLVHVKCE
jgi:hypothetical protein